MLKSIGGLKGLRLKFGLIALALFVLWTMVGIYLNIYRVDRMMGRELEDKAALSARILAQALAGHMQASEYDRVSLEIDHLHEDLEISYVEVVDSVGGAIKKAGELREDGSLVFSTAGIRSDGIDLGTVKVGIGSESNEDSVGEYVLSHVLMVVLLGLVSILVLIYSFNRLVLMPLSRMNGILEDMTKGGGDLTQRLDFSSNDEIGELAENFNNFLGRLRGLVARAQDASLKVFALSERIGRKSKTLMSSAKEQVGTTNENFQALERMDKAVQDVAGSAESLSMSAMDSSATVTEMAAQVDSVADSTIDLTGHVDETSSSISEMASSIKEVAESVMSLADLASQTASSVSQIEASIREVETRAKEAASLSQEVSNDADTLGNDAIARTIEGMERIRNSVDEASEVIDALSIRSVEIDKIVKVIDEVTNQTSLLALNAAILAAQAGEQGKGFEVVASEIKDLAERTSSSTGEIGRLIKTVQKESKEAVESMKVGKERVLEGAQMAYGAADALSKMLESSTRSMEAAMGIERATTQQVLAVRQVTEAMMNVHEKVQFIERATIEQSKGSELISGAAEKISVIAKEVKKAMAEQARGIRGFALSIEESKEMVGGIAGAMKGQKEDSAAIITSMEKILDIAQNNSDISVEMEKAVEDLLREAKNLQTEMDEFTV